MTSTPSTKYFTVPQSYLAAMSCINPSLGQSEDGILKPGPFIRDLHVEFSSSEAVNVIQDLFGGSLIPKGVKKTAVIVARNVDRFMD